MYQPIPAHCQTCTLYTLLIFQLNPDVNSFQRKFVSEIVRCEEMERKLSKFINAIYCKFGNFCENFILVNSDKRHICSLQTLGLRYDLPISVKKRVILPFREGLIFTKLGICEVSRK